MNKEFLPKQYLHYPLYIMKKLTRLIFILSLLIGGIQTVTAQCTKPMPTNRILMNTSGSGNVIIHEYDVVDYVISNRPVKGQASQSVYFNNAVYRFSTYANKEVFKREPVKYTPGFGGYCPVAASMGDVEDIENDQFEVYNGKLYLFMNKKAKEMWVKDKVNILAKATANWPCLTIDKGRKIK